mmetsp:Transcript_122418/g.341206  ORF Transcript_122418/g.341206 Transcript_122418/m.341206 type:complete len:309 (-) Transcript_122418:946-1872(-)
MVPLCLLVEPGHRGLHLNHVRARRASGKVLHDFLHGRQPLGVALVHGAVPVVAARLAVADAALRDEPARQVAEGLRQGVPRQCADHDEVGVRVLRDDRQVGQEHLHVFNVKVHLTIEVRRGQLREDLRVDSRQVRQQRAGEAQNDHPPVGLAHGRHGLVVVQLRWDLQALVLALALGGLQLLEEVPGPAVQRVVLDVVAAVAVQLDAVLRIHLQGLLDGFGKSIGVPGVHAERGCTQGLGAAGELGQDQHATLLLLLAVEEGVTGVRKHVSQRRVHHDAGLGAECDQIHVADALAQEMDRQVPYRAKL